MGRLHIAGTGASPGIGVGHAVLYPAPASAPPAQHPSAPIAVAARPAELARLRAALDRASADLARLHADVAVQLGAAEAAVFDAQALFLRDPALLEPLEAAVAAEGRPASAAVRDVFAQAAAVLESLDDPTLRARTVDLHDVQGRLIQLLADSPHPRHYQDRETTGDTQTTSTDRGPRWHPPMKPWHTPGGGSASFAMTPQPPMAPAGAAPADEARPPPSLLPYSVSLRAASVPPCLRGERPPFSYESQVGGPSAVLPADTILVAHDLTPSETVGLPLDRVRGVVLAAGTPAAHASILARGLGLPLVVGAGPLVEQIASGELVLLDGRTGDVLIGPSPGEVAAYHARSAPQALHVASGTHQHGPISAVDGRRIELLANASSVAEAHLALDHGAEGIGLLRTEFLLAALSGPTPPSVDVLADAYEAILRPMGSRPVTVRAMDAGGDKPLPFLDVGHEPNPFLGWRGVRILLDRPDLFAHQTRALLRAAARCEATVRLLIPMIGDSAEFLRARALVEAVVQQEHYPHPLPIGAMIEVPSAALLTDSLAGAADFFSLGTNDLAQYTLARDRGNPRVADRCRFLHPAVLRLVSMAVQAAHAANRSVGICGEAAGDLDAVPILVGLGVDELSVGPARLSAVRACLQTLRYDTAQALAAEALRRTTAEEIAELAAR